jgi:hypothetical protein
LTYTHSLSPLTMMLVDDNFVAVVVSLTRLINDATRCLQLRY